MGTTNQDAEGRRYRLRLRSLKFLSLVDTPAQETASVLLTKRADAAGELAIAGVASIVKVVDELGLVFAWAWTGKKNGADYFDLHGDAIVDDDEMVKVAAEFMAGSRAQDTQHDRNPDGMVVFAMPMTPEIAKAFGVQTETTGLMVAVKPSAETFAAVKRGELRGISLDGTGVREAAKAARAVRKDSALTTATDGHSHLVDDCCQAGLTSYATGMDGNGHTHPYVIADNGIVTIGMAAGHTHAIEAATVEPDDVTLADGVKSGQREVVRASTARILTPSGSLADLGKRAPDLETDQETATMATTDIDKKLADSEARAIRAEAIAEMTDVQRTHFRGLPAASQTELLAKSTGDRRVALEKATEVVYKAADGTEYRASDDQRLVTMAKRADESDAATKTVVLEKRAESLTSHMKGTIGVRSALVRAIDAIADEPTRKAAFESLKAANDIARLASKEFGVGSVGSHDDTTAEAQMTKMADEYAAANKVTKARAVTHLLDHSADFRALKGQADRDRHARARA